MKILFIDHFDSFSNNIINFFRAKKCQVDTCFYTHLYPSEMKVKDREEKSLMNPFKYDAIIFSPGPGNPREYPQTLKFYRSLPSNIPILGICLGHQIMLYGEGGSIKQIYDKPIHGKQLQLNTFIDSHYLGKKNLTGTCVLYHSLGFHIDDPIFHTWNILLHHDGVCLMTEHKKKTHLGVQFHPESFASTIGTTILNLFIRSIK